MAADRMPGLIPTKSTRTPGRIRSRSIEFLPASLSSPAAGALTIENYELVVQGRADALRLRRARQGQNDGLERREEPARAEAPARGEEGGPHLLLPHRRR